ncbi:TetR/AcrR family transcriptional regulator [Nocardiopsis algeriensis]|uniref:AcrR family transcriptional regulator n=1 Tax=Nocardiopsis algeriensis TaxID=1478215 RepID=A0A841IRU1_9ACTN|nr:TetR/AcrR family transcriptional regulator [Nocardiopsis algeriensis]MBB6121599.1 AcrR family transcriptional regulator [Nocardiopsis algeriensis]
MDDRITPPRSRHAALKARHRRAIIDAAAALIHEAQGPSFTVDALAERADVSRRTVFNHFASVDDIVLEVCGEVIEAVTDSLEADLAARAAGGAGSASVFDQVADALREADLVPPITYLTRILGSEDREPSPRQAALLERVMGDLSARLAATVTRHHPSTDTLVVDLMFAALVSGLLVIHHRWNAATGGVDTEESRRTWAELLERLIEMTRTGYGAVGPGL